MDALQKPRVVVLSDNAPYLGGPQTWRPLCESAPEYDFVAIDPLDYVDARVSVDDYVTAIKDAIGDALPGAAAVIAHGSLGGFAIEAIAETNAEAPLLLLEPRLIRKDLFRVRAARWLLTGAIGGSILAAVAKKKYRRLIADRAFVLDQLEIIVREGMINDALLDEACTRLLLPQTKCNVDRIADSLRVMFRTINPSASAKVKPRLTLVGPHWPKSKVRDDPSIRVLDQCKMAPCSTHRISSLRLFDL